MLSNNFNQAIPTGYLPYRSSFYPGLITYAPVFFPYFPYAQNLYSQDDARLSFNPNTADLTSLLLQFIQSQGIGSLEVTEEDDPEAIEITNPQQVQSIANMLGLPVVNPQMPILPQEYKELPNPESVTYAQTPPTNAVSGSSGAAQYGSTARIKTYPDPPRGFVSMHIPWVGKCTRTFRLFGKKHKIRYWCLKRSLFSLFATISYSEITKESVEFQLKACLQSAISAAKASAITAIIYTSGDTYTKASAALAAGWTSFQLAMSDCLKQIRDEYHVSYKMWYKID